MTVKLKHPETGAVAEVPSEISARRWRETGWEDAPDDAVVDALGETVDPARARRLAAAATTEPSAPSKRALWDRVKEARERGVTVEGVNSRSSADELAAALVAAGEEV